jgi:large subunit ribosomal protein L29
MKTQEVRLKTDDELKAMLTDLKKESLNLRFQRANGQLEKSHRMRQARREAATVATLLAERAKGIDRSKVKTTAKKATKTKAKKA